MYGAIIYQKAPIVMRHLEALLGEDNFRDGLREYLKAHAFANATWSDLINVLDARTPMDLQQWSQVWVDQPGRPSVETILEMKNGSITKLAFRQRDSWNRNRVWPQQLRVAMGSHAPQQIINVEMTGREVEVKQAVGQPAPRFVLPNGGGWAYGDFTLDKTTLAYLTTNLPDIADPLTRGSAWVTLWDALLDGQVQPDAFLDLTLRSLPRETDEQMTSRVLGYAVEHLVAVPRSAAADDTSGAIRVAAPRGSARKPARRARRRRGSARLRNVALTPATVDVAAAGLGEEGNRHRASARRSGLHVARARARRAPGGRLERHPEDAAVTHRESGSARPIPVRDAGTVGGSGGAREVVPVAPRRRRIAGASRGSSRG